MIGVLSQIVLGLSSIFAALLLYRQSEPLTDKSKVIASLLTICCLFISASSLFTLFINESTNDVSVFRLMLTNLHFFLAIPLLSSILIASSFNSEFSKAAWGRWILALLATFELCRRAEIGHYYSDFVIYTSCIIIVFSLLYKEFLGKTQRIRSDLVLKCIAIICYSASLLLFSQQAIITDFISESYYNFFLAVGLPMICLLIGKMLNTINISVEKN